MIGSRLRRRQDDGGSGLSLQQGLLRHVESNEGFAYFDGRGRNGRVDADVAYVRVRWRRRWRSRIQDERRRCRRRRGGSRLRRADERHLELALRLRELRLLVRHRGLARDATTTRGRGGGAIVDLQARMHVDTAVVHGGRDKHGLDVGLVLNLGGRHFDVECEFRESAVVLFSNFL